MINFNRQILCLHYIVYNNRASLNIIILLIYIYFSMLSLYDASLANRKLINRRTKVKNASTLANFVTVFIWLP